MLAEAMPAVLLAACMTIGGARALRDEWRRVECAHRAFEAAHAALRGGRVPGARVVDRGRSIEATAICGSARETVALWKLEYAQW